MTDAQAGNGIIPGTSILCVRLSPEGFIDKTDAIRIINNDSRAVRILDDISAARGHGDFDRLVTIEYTDNGERVQDAALIHSA